MSTDSGAKCRLLSLCGPRQTTAIGTGLNLKSKKSSQNKFLFGMICFLAFSNVSAGFGFPRCGNVAAILEFDENLKQSFRIFEASVWHLFPCWQVDAETGRNSKPQCFFLHFHCYYALCTMYNCIMYYIRMYNVLCIMMYHALYIIIITMIIIIIIVIIIIIIIVIIIIDPYSQ